MMKPSQPQEDAAAAAPLVAVAAPLVADPWLWRAVYADDSLLDEEGDPDAPDGRRGWAQVALVATARQTTLRAVLLLPTRPDLATHVIGAQSTDTHGTLDDADALTRSPTRSPTVRVFRRRRIT
ncbi:MAG: hypothetical protein KGK07_16010, partial [Chloroflexota bacterium]|nr:hypothetical protein [Chloroflexota bacterium]